MSSLRSRVHWSAAVALAACPVLGGGTARAQTRATGDLKLTLVARVCAGYGDVMASRQRDNNMQSLEDLGRDSAHAPDLL
ncbi:hypothetical protein, partial [Streptomyces sp. CB01881]|uniref:hypothetical protein n=1 Tax=Streptomyces sp. CB01881 TaxID=2078691 RepID=UPI0018847AB9